MTTFTADKEGNPDKEAEAALRTALTVTGVGSHPALVKFLATIADATFVEEGGPEPGGDGNQAGEAGGLYPHLNPN